MGATFGRPRLHVEENGPCRLDTVLQVMIRVVMNEPSIKANEIRHFYNFPKGNSRSNGEGDSS